MLTDRQRREYHKRRAKGLGASTSLAIAREVDRTFPWTDYVADQWDRCTVESNGFTMPEYPGMQFTVQLKDDDTNDFSHLGRFTSSGDRRDLTDGTLLKNNGGRDAHDYFEPSQSVRDRARDLIDLKFGRRDAWETAWAYAKEDHQHAVEYRACGVVLTAYTMDGTEIGSASLWGIDDSDYAKTSVVGELFDEAVREAREAMARLLEHAKKIAPVVRGRSIKGERALDFT